MEVKIQISDAVYATLLNGSTRIKGSIALVSPKEGNFNAYRKHTSPETRTNKYMKLPHGKVSMNDDRVRLCLNIAYTEQVIPARVIEAESNMASSFIELMEEIQ